MTTPNNTGVVETETTEIMETETVPETHNRVKGSTIDKIVTSLSHKKAKSTKSAKSQKKDSKKAKKGTKSGSYKRGSLTAAIYALFDKKGVDNVGLDEALKLALSVKSDSKFNKYHLAWYKNAYRNKE
jgi:hypothetical protein